MSSTTHVCYVRVLQSKTASSMAVTHLLQEVVSWPHPKVDIRAVSWLLVKDDVEDAANFLPIFFSANFLVDGITWLINILWERLSYCKWSKDDLTYFLEMFGKAEIVFMIYLYDIIYLVAQLWKIGQCN